MTAASILIGRVKNVVFARLIGRSYCDSLTGHVAFCVREVLNDCERAIEICKILDSDYPIRSTDSSNFGRVREAQEEI